MWRRGGAAAVTTPPLRVSGSLEIDVRGRAERAAGSVRGNETRCGSRSSSSSSGRSRRAEQTLLLLLHLLYSSSPLSAGHHAPSGIMLFLHELLSPCWIAAEWKRKSTLDLNLRTCLAVDEISARFVFFIIIIFIIIINIISHIYFGLFLPQGDMLALLVIIGLAVLSDAG